MFKFITRIYQKRFHLFSKISIFRVSYVSKLTLYYLGKVSITKKKVAINMSTKQCLKCSTNECYHYKALEYCSELSLEATVSHQKDNIFYYHIDSETIFLTDNVVAHCFICRENSWNCASCEKCNYLSLAKEISLQLEVDPPFPPNRTITDEYSTISTLPIPKMLNEKLASVYRQQLTNGLHLPTDIYPEAILCSNGFPLDMFNLERKGIIIYMDNDIQDLKDHKGNNMYSRTSII